MSASATAAPPSVPPTPSTPRRRNPWYLVVAVVIVVVIAAVAVVVVLRAPSSPTTGSVLTYSGARSVADRTVGGFEGGGWNLLFAAGVAPAVAVSAPEGTSTTLANLSCTYNPVGSPRNVTVPAFTGNRSAGLAPAWEFGYTSISSDAIALVSVVNGTGNVTGTLTGGDCAYADLLPGVPGSVIDSSRAAAIVAPYARPFLMEYPNASAAFVLGPSAFFGGSGLSYDWTVLYSTCSLTSGTSGTGGEFNATVNALNGTVVGTPHTTTGATCTPILSTTARSPGSHGTVSSLFMPVLRGRPGDGT